MSSRATNAGTRGVPKCPSHQCFSGLQFGAALGALGRLSVRCLEGLEWFWDSFGKLRGEHLGALGLSWGAPGALWGNYCFRDVIGCSRGGVQGALVMLLATLRLS